MKYSFLTSVYKNTNVNEMKETFASLFAQTIPADEIVIVEDGTVSDNLQQYLNELEAENPQIKRVKLSENQGLGIALQKGLEACSNDIVARIDTDDVCAVNRMEFQLAQFEKNPELDLVGSNMSEFQDSADNIVSVRTVPETHEEICAYMKARCPFNHISVVFKKSSVLKAGNYQPWHYNEDYYLWIRMYLKGCKFYNVQEVLCSARVNEAMYQRRGGIRYFKSEKNIFRFMRKNKMISFFAYEKAVFLRFVLQILLPNRMRKWVFLHFARQRKEQ